eukprot:TRINITY_DN67080_c6_g9_i1.p1 TRINITY_DN67080_c6_g9~~TRINITY_DN67080_c6_g9_i1.p1  ORF type:complete len:489 (-),score=91.30 TRINITY_DN67080_c6_g9_i1:28-1494(-)
MTKNLLFLFLTFVALARLEETSDVVVLTDDSIASVLEENETVFVEFYAPWCGHCKKLTPEYEAFATAMKGTGAVVAKIDATEHKKAAGKYGVRGYPTLKCFNSGSPSDYKGGRTAADMEKFLRKQMGPAVTVLKTVDEVKEFIPSDSQAFGKMVAFYADENGAVGKAYNEYAKAKRNDYEFGVVNSERIATEFKQNMESVVMFKGGDTLPIAKTQDLDKKGMDEWVKLNWFPLVGEINADNHAAYSSRGKNLIYLFVDPADKATFDKTMVVYEEVAGDNPTFSFGWLNGPAQIKTAQKLGFKGKEFPMLATQESGDTYLFPEGGEFTLETVGKWAKDLGDGKLQPFVKSEPIPENPLDGDVRVVVGDNFKQVVMDEEKDVLIEFYAPWCGHCKKIAPIYSELAGKFKGVDTVVIAKMDATANDMPRKQFPVKGFPTIKFCKGKTNEVIAYNGDRSLDSFVKFVETNAHFKFDLNAGEKKPEESKHDEL